MIIVKSKAIFISLKLLLKTILELHLKNNFKTIYLPKTVPHRIKIYLNRFNLFLWAFFSEYGWLEKNLMRSFLNSHCSRELGNSMLTIHQSLLQLCKIFVWHIVNALNVMKSNLSKP